MSALPEPVMNLRFLKLGNGNGPQCDMSILINDNTACNCRLFLPVCRMSLYLYPSFHMSNSRNAHVILLVLGIN